MRTIKFRVWDKINQRFLGEQDNFLLNEAGQIWWVDKQGKAWTYDLDIMYVIQQFTGQHDKNDKEIYEGDIVLADRQDSFSSWNKGYIFYSDYYSAFTIQYFKKSPKEFPEVGFDTLHQWKLEVVGNIYENPELLPK